MLTPFLSDFSVFATSRLRSRVNSIGYPFVSSLHFRSSSSSGERDDLFRPFQHIQADKTFVQPSPDFHSSYPPNEELGITVYPSILTPKAQDLLLSTAELNFKRKRYTSSHFDNVIRNYREFEIIPNNSRNIYGLEESESNDVYTIIAGIRNILLQNHPSTTLQSSLDFLPPHFIDLQQERGVIHPHVDSVKFSGGLVSGLSLISTKIMRLRWAPKHEIDSEAGMTTTDYAKISEGGRGYINLFLCPGSLYCLEGAARYAMTHEILDYDLTDSKFPTDCKSRRVSLMFRDSINCS